ncbi:cytochrome b5-like heme/steroid binding domain-containing protein, partial [Colletotrichum godetiae]
VRQHHTVDDCWMVIHGKVYDITSFLPSHPGGKAILLRNAGKDATAVFDAVHPVELVEEYLRPDQLMG